MQTSEDFKNKAIQDALRKTTAPKIVRHAGQLNWIEVEGKKVYRQEFVDIPSVGKIRCSPTDNHFVYRLDPKIFHKPGWTLFCTCGSPSVVVDHEAYKELASNSGQMLVCMSMVTSGRHSDGGQ